MGHKEAWLSPRAKEKAAGPGPSQGRKAIHQKMRKRKSKGLMSKCSWGHTATTGPVYKRNFSTLLGSSLSTTPGHLVMESSRAIALLQGQVL